MAGELTNFGKIGRGNWKKTLGILMLKWVADFGSGCCVSPPYCAAAASLLWGALWTDEHFGVGARRRAARVRFGGQRRVETWTRVEKETAPEGAVGSKWLWLATAL